MKKYLVLFILLMCGCSNKTTLTCTYIDQTSIYGIKKIVDKIYFKNDKITSYEKSIDFTLNNEIKETNKTYKIIKNEAKTLKKYIGGKYKINKTNKNINMLFTVNKIKKDNLKYINIDIEKNYIKTKEIYTNKGFECK